MAYLPVRNYFPVWGGLVYADQSRFCCPIPILWGLKLYRVLYVIFLVISYLPLLLLLDLDDCKKIKQKLKFVICCCCPLIYDAIATCYSWHTYHMQK